MSREKQPLWWEIFITEYLKNGQNGRAAYLKAKPKVKLSTAGTEAEKLLKKPEFQEALEKSREKIIEKTGMSREKWMNILCDVAELDITEFLCDDNGDIDLIQNWKEKAGKHAIEAMDTRTTTLESGQVVRRVFIKKENKLKALEVIGKSLGYLTDKVEHSGSVSIVVEDPYAQPKD